jgi:hypothetical protein
MTGGACGSLFAQGFHLSAAERKTLLVAGAAGGMAAIFAAPLASVLLAVELLLFEWKPRSFIPVAAACAMAAALRVPLLGPGPIFPVALHAALPWRELALSLPLGIAAGFGLGCITWLVYSCEDLFERVPLNRMWWPVIGGAVVGLGGLIQPRVLGVGYDTIADLLRGQLTGSLPLVLLVTKAVDLGRRTRLRNLGRRARTPADHGRIARRGRGPSDTSGREWALGHDEHGGHDGRHHAIASHRRSVHARADRRSRGPSRAVDRLCGGPWRYHAAHPIDVSPNELLRLCVINAGPNRISSFHVVGGIFQRVFQDGSQTSPLAGVQTVNVPVGGGSIFEVRLREPGDYPFVTHAFADATKGAVGVLRALAPGEKPSGPERAMTH